MIKGGQAPPFKLHERGDSVANRSKRDNPYYEAYMKERRRLQRFISRGVARGYGFYENIPNIPDTITKSDVNALKRMTPTYMYERSFYGGVGTEDFVSGLEGRAIERSLSAQKGFKTRRAKQTFPSYDIEDFESGYLPLQEDTAFNNMYEDFVKKISIPIEIIGTNVPQRILNAQYAAMRAQQDIIAYINSENSIEIGRRLLEADSQDIDDAVKTIIYQPSSEDAVEMAYNEIMDILTNDSLTIFEREAVSNFGENGDSYI